MTDPSEILLYTFGIYRNTTYKIVSSGEFDKYSRYYIRGKEGHNKLINYVLESHYKYILGFGDFRKDSKRIRVESCAVNRYGKGEIVPDSETFLYSTLSLDVDEPSYLSDKPSNGPCNRSLYLLLQSGQDLDYEYKTAFVHIPKNFETSTAIEMIKHWIGDLSRETKGLPSQQKSLLHL